MTAYEKLKELPITLPVAEAADAAFFPTVRTGNLPFVLGAHRKAGWETLGGEIGRSAHYRRRKAGSSQCGD
jgi:hypothetical protein